MKTDRRWYNDDRLSRECREWSDRALQCVGVPVEAFHEPTLSAGGYEGRVCVRYQLRPTEIRRLRVTLPK